MASTARENYDLNDLFCLTRCENASFQANSLSLLSSAGGGYLQDRSPADGICLGGLMIPFHAKGITRQQPSIWSPACCAVISAALTSEA